MVLQNDIRIGVHQSVANRNYMIFSRDAREVEGKLFTSAAERQKFLAIKASVSMTQSCS